MAKRRRQVRQRPDEKNLATEIEAAPRGPAARVLVVVAFLAAVAGCAGASSGAIERSAAPEPAATPAVSEPRVTTTSAAPTTSTTVTTTSAPDPAAATRAAGRAPWTLAPYHGLGAWLDAFDWSVEFARAPEHTVGLDAVDHLAAEGVQTIYIQASRWNASADVIEPERLEPLIERAHSHGMSVVAWYLPTFVDPEADLRRLLALADLPVDGLGVDIESRDVGDPVERTRRLLDVSRRLDAALGGRPLAAIVIEPVVIEDVNPNYWPGFPWAELAETYDVWMPMGYWTNRVGPWRDAATYTGVNIGRIRERIGQPDAPVHAIGGIGDETTGPDLEGMLRAATEHGVIGGSIYDYRTTAPEHWPLLRQFRRS